MVEFIVRRMEEKKERESLGTRNAYNVANPKQTVLHLEITNCDFCGTSTQTENYFKIWLGI